jgi:hypothetical protein
MVMMIVLMVTIHIHIHIQIGTHIHTDIETHVHVDVLLILLIRAVSEQVIREGDVAEAISIIFTIASSLIAWVIKIHGVNEGDTIRCLLELALTL